MSNAGGSTSVPSSDPIGEALWQIVAAVLLTMLALALLPLVVPVLATVIAGEHIAVKARFWAVWRWQWVVNTAGILAVLVLLSAEALLLSQWVRSGAADAFFQVDGWPAQLLPTFGPWALLNLVAGVLLLPAAWSLHRRRIATRVRTRRISDVVRQTRIETARKRAADLAAARLIGVEIDAPTGRIVGTRGTVLTAPLAAGGRQAFGLVTSATVRNLPEHLYDARSVRDWTADDGRLAALPSTASAVRAVLLAESGTGKTVLLMGQILCALEYGWPVVMIDAKGDPADAAALAAIARSYGRTAMIGGPSSVTGRGQWNIFAGSAQSVTEKLMRLMPTADGANQYYLDEIRGALQAVQDLSPIRSVADLRERLTDPVRHTRDQFDADRVNMIVDSRTGLTAGTRVLHTLDSALRPLEAWISPNGWSYERPAADVTIVPLAPVDAAQARLGDLLLLDLRNYMATRLAAGDKTPMLVVVDEFPQLVTGAVDPGDTAGSLFETARSAGMGLILAAQSAAGVSNDETRRRRALASGAALIFGRSKDPEDVVSFAGTVMQMEASGAAGGEELRSARAQHTYVVPPQDVREAADGQFWLVQAGSVLPFRALPNGSVDPTKVAGASE